MKNYFLTLALAALVFSCTSEEATPYDPYNGDLSSLEGTASVSDLKATLTNSEGRTITDFTELLPNSKYRIILSSDAAEFIRIKNGDGYQLISGPSLAKHSIGKSEYTIVTTSDFTDQIFINVVPIHQQDGGYKRERSQVFLLPQ